MSKVISVDRAASKRELWLSYSHIFITNLCSENRGMRQIVQSYVYYFCRHETHWGDRQGMCVLLFCFCAYFFARVYIPLR